MKKLFIKLMVLPAVISFCSVTIGFAAVGSVGLGDISVYKSGQLVSKLTGQNPIEDGTLLVCNGKCIIKSEGISLIGAKNAEMATASEADTFKLYVKEGKVDYIITSNVRTISFHTPQGTYTVAEVVFNAGNDSVVKGSVVVDTDGKTEIFVTEGRMVFATAEGLKTIDANHKFVLAVAPAAGAAGTGTAGASTGVGFGTGAMVLGGEVLAGVIIDNEVKYNNDSPDSVPSASPSM